MKKKWKHFCYVIDTAYGAHKHSTIVIGYVRYIRLIRRTYDIKLVLTGLRTMKKQILSNIPIFIVFL